MMDDLISRQQAIDALKQFKPEIIPYEKARSYVEETIDTMYNRIEDLPTIQPEPKKGEWLPDNNNAYEMRFVCSCCKESEVVPTIGFTKYRPLWDFCPNCGADMRGEQDEL